MTTATSSLPTWAFPRFRSLIYGATLPFQAAKLILSRPALIFWSTLPIGLTLCLYFFLIRWLQGEARGWLGHQFIQWGWNPEGWLAWALSISTQILLLLVGAVTFSVGASLVASPFNDFLAEKTEPLALPPLPPTTATNTAAKIRLMLIDVLKSVCALAASIIALLVSWIPGLNILAMLTVFLLVTFQYISYPQTRRGQGVRVGLTFLLRHPFASSAFGATLSLLFAIPVLSSFAVPLAVVGGTLLVARAQRTPSNFQLR